VSDDLLSLSMPLSWDIETLGIDKKNDLITVISLYDPEANIERVLRFVDLNYDGNVVYCDDYKTTVATFIEYLDNAESLCGFNTMSFDLPFVQIQFNIPNETVQRWVLKTYDILEICRRGFGRTINLNSCLALNGVGDGGKTGTGLEAVRQALSGEWEKLEQYCADDARLTYELSTLPVIYCPENYQWRKSHNDRTHDASRVLMIHTDKFPALSFKFGPMAGYNAGKVEDDVLGKRAAFTQV
jgi:RNase_H superfamily